VPAKNNDLHGSAPETCPVALLMIDVINDLDFEGGDRLLQNALPMAHKLAELARRARSAGIPVIYVNDNFGKWRSDFRMQLEHSRADGVRGKPIADLLVPDKNDYFVLKPKHSGFFATTLDTLLEYLGVKTVILTGIATDLCVLFTASDAHMRDLFLVVPEDCCASETVEEHNQALGLMKRKFDADTTDSTSLDLNQLLRNMTDT
jgi:nicotinamidase-related amidase